ncbi:MAG TPA: YafY family protein [Usitatibacter sp.]|nr:YafY family protein [Usitatibacter sp.]
MSQPTTRVLAVLELLQSHPQMSGAELARRIEVDPRTLRRYIAMLEEMGIPITTEQGRYGGYRLVPGFKLPPMMFTEEEAQAISLGLIAARGLGLADAAPAIESVQAKLDRVLTSAPRKTLAAMRESVALQTTDARTTADSRLLRILSETAQQRVTASLRYRAADGAATSREFDVYGLVFRNGRWYVVGFCHLRQGLRTLRLDRVVHAEATQLRFDRPEGFDASEYLSRAMATLPRAIPVEILLRTDIDTAKFELVPALGIVEKHADGVMLKGSTDELEWYARELMRLPFEFEVRTPVSLRATLARVAAEVVRRFTAVA